LPINKAKELIKKKCPMKWWANKEGQWHREDGPAIESADGDKEWYINGKRHREDGPAIERADGYKEYWINNKKVEEKDLPINKEKELTKEEWPKCIINEYGTKVWKNKDERFHREDGPAIEYTSGDKFWYINGKLHRDNGPAKDCANGDKLWYRNGLCHREDGPAIECASGNKHWYLNDKHHRKDGPAVERANGDKLWFINGESHREDGPAIERADGYKEYWINNKRVEEKDLPINKSTNALDIVKADSKKALYRTINKQGIKLIKNSIIKLMESKNIKSDQIKAIGKFLNTEVGYGLISFILGMALTYAPKIKDNKHIKEISKETRIEGLAGVGEFITKEILEIIIKGNQVSKIRVQENLEIENEEQIEDESCKAELTIN
jgi:hypothetical protein